METQRNYREQATRLRAATAAIIEETGLMALLRDRFGQAHLTGSAAYDLMAWPDIDIHMPVDPRHRIEYAALLPEIAAGFESAGLRVHKAQFLDDYVDPHPLGAGLYWGIIFRDRDDLEWKSDLWGWAPDDFAARHTRDMQIAAALKGADRDHILALKADALAQPGCYGSSVLSVDIYRYVLAGGAGDIDDLLAWKARQPS